MGQTKEIKCRECGNIWTHYEGVGFMMKPIKGSKKSNTTGDADKVIKCPQCGSQNYEDVKNGIIEMWD